MDVLSGLVSGYSFEVLKQARNTQILKYPEPILDEVKRGSTVFSSRGEAARSIIHYMGHGVGHVTDQEIWLYSDHRYTTCTGYKIHDLVPAVGFNSVFVLDCHSAGSLIQKFREIAQIVPTGSPLSPMGSILRNQFSFAGSLDSSIPRPDSPICICACSAGETLPSVDYYPADILSSCITSPLRMAFLRHLRQARLRGGGGMSIDIPLFQEGIFNVGIGWLQCGLTNNKLEPMFELQLILTTVLDSIAQQCWPLEHYRALFQRDRSLGIIMCSFILATRILTELGVHPCAFPAFPTENVLHSRLWGIWDATLDEFFTRLSTYQDTLEIRLCRRDAMQMNPPRVPHGESVGQNLLRASRMIPPLSMMGPSQQKSPTFTFLPERLINKSTAPSQVAANAGRSSIRDLVQALDTTRGTAKLHELIPSPYRDSFKFIRQSASQLDWFHALLAPSRAGLVRSAAPVLGEELADRIARCTQHEAASQYRFFPFFAQQLHAMEVWLEQPNHQRSIPPQLSICVQALPAQSLQLRAGTALARFVDLGLWSIDHALNSSILDKALQSICTACQQPQSEALHLLLFILAKCLSASPKAVVDHIMSRRMTTGQPIFPYIAGVAVSTVTPADRRFLSLYIITMCARLSQLAREQLVDYRFIDGVAPYLISQFSAVRLWAALSIASILEPDPAIYKRVLTAYDSPQTASRVLRHRIPRLLRPLSTDTNPGVRAAGLQAATALMASPFAFYLQISCIRGVFSRMGRQSEKHQDPLPPVSPLHALGPWLQLVNDQSALVRRVALSLVAQVITTLPAEFAQLLAERFSRSQQIDSTLQSSTGSAHTSDMRTPRIITRTSPAVGFTPAPEPRIFDPSTPESPADQIARPETTGAPHQTPQRVETVLGQEDRFHELVCDERSQAILGNITDALYGLAVDPIPQISGRATSLLWLISSLGWLIVVQNNGAQNEYTVTTRDIEKLQTRMNFTFASQPTPAHNSSSTDVRMSTETIARERMRLGDIEHGHTIHAPPSTASRHIRMSSTRSLLSLVATPTTEGSHSRHGSTAPEPAPQPSDNRTVKGSLRQEFLAARAVQLVEQCRSFAGCHCSSPLVGLFQSILITPLLPSSISTLASFAASSVHSSFIFCTQHGFARRSKHNIRRVVFPLDHKQKLFTRVRPRAKDETAVIGPRDCQICEIMRLNHVTPTTLAADTAAGASYLLDTHGAVVSSEVVPIESQLTPQTEEQVIYHMVTHGSKTEAQPSQLMRVEGPFKYLLTMRNPVGNLASQQSQYSRKTLEQYPRLMIELRRFYKSPVLPPPQDDIAAATDECAGDNLARILMQCQVMPSTQLATPGFQSPLRSYSTRSFSMLGRATNDPHAIASHRSLARSDHSLQKMHRVNSVGPLGYVVSLDQSLEESAPAIGGVKPTPDAPRGIQRRLVTVPLVDQAAMLRSLHAVSYRMAEDSVMLISLHSQRNMKLECALWDQYADDVAFNNQQFELLLGRSMPVNHTDSPGVEFPVPVLPYRISAFFPLDNDDTTRDEDGATLRGEEIAAVVRVARAHKLQSFGSAAHDDTHGLQRFTSSQAPKLDLDRYPDQLNYLESVCMHKSVAQHLRELIEKRPVMRVINTCVAVLSASIAATTRRMTVVDGQPEENDALSLADESVMTVHGAQVVASTASIAAMHSTMQSEPTSVFLEDTPSDIEDEQTAKAMRSFRNSPTTCLAFHPIEDLLLVGDNRGFLSTWRSTEGKLLATTHLPTIGHFMEGVTPDMVMPGEHETPSWTAQSAFFVGPTDTSTAIIGCSDGAFRVIRGVNTTQARLVAGFRVNSALSPGIMWPNDALHIIGSLQDNTEDISGDIRTLQQSLQSASIPRYVDRLTHRLISTYCPEAGILAGSYGSDVVKLYDVQTETCVGKLRLETQVTSPTDLSTLRRVSMPASLHMVRGDTNMLAIGHSSGFVELSDTRTLSRAVSIAYDQGCMSVRFLSDTDCTKLVTCSQEGVVRLFDARSPAQGPLIEFPCGLQPDPIPALDVHSNAGLIAVGSNRLRIWSANGKALSEIHRSDSPTTDNQIAFHPTRLLLAASSASDRGTVKIYSHSGYNQ